MSVRRRSMADESGATLPELAVAGVLMLTAIAMAGGTVLAPLRALERIAAVDEEAAELGNALDSVARIVRAARPDIDGPAVIDRHQSLGTTTLQLRVTGGGASGVVTLALDGQELHLTASEGVPALHAGLLVTGLDAERSRIDVLTAKGSEVDASRLHDVSAVRVLLHRGGHEVSRTIHLRAVRPLGTVRR